MGLQLSKSFCRYLSLRCLPSAAVSVLCPRKMARLLQRHDSRWTSVQHIVPRGLSQSRAIGCERASRELARNSDAAHQYPLSKFGVPFSSIVLFMPATTASLLLDECNIACSLNYGAALMRGLSEAADKMNTIPQLLPLMNCGKRSNLHGGRYDVAHPCSGLLLRRRRRRRSRT